MIRKLLHFNFAFCVRLRRILLLSIFYFLFHTASAQVICIFCFDQNDSISQNVNNFLLNGGFENTTCVPSSGVIGSGTSWCPNSNDYSCDWSNWTCTGGGTTTYSSRFTTAYSTIPEGMNAVYFGNYYCQACNTIQNDTSCIGDSLCTTTGIPAGYPFNPDVAGFGGSIGLSLEQTVTGLLPGSVYVLEFWAGGEYLGGSVPDLGLFAVDVGFGKTFLRNKSTGPGGFIGTEFIIEFIAAATSHTIRFTNWGHICGSCTELVLDNVRLYTLAELSSSVTPCAGATPTAIFTAPNHICPNSCISFTNLSSGATTYQWIFPGANPSTSTDANPQFICYDSSGQFSVTLIAGNGTIYDTLTLNNYITVYPQPPVPAVTQQGDTLFATQGYASYQWYFGSDTIAGATNYFYVATQSGNYNIAVTDDNGCSVGAGILNVIASIQLAIGNWQLAIYPNPVKDELTVSKIQFANCEMEIYNSLGEKIYSQHLQNSSCKLQTANWSDGIYMLQIKSQTEIIYKKFVISK